MTLDIIPVLQLTASAHGVLILLGVVLVAMSVRPLQGLIAEVSRARSRARRVLLLGTRPRAARLMAELGARTGSRCTVVGVVDDKRPDPAIWGNTPWLGQPDRLGEIVEQVKPGRILIALGDCRGRLPLTLLVKVRANGVAVEDDLKFYERISGKIAIEALPPSSLILSTGFRHTGAAETAARIVTLFVVATGLALLVPLLVLIAIAIKLDSRGPVLFVQDRAGLGGEPFRLLKFRTMHPCADQRSEWVHDNNDRITRLGKWLRRFRLDELPQLINVLQGEMNLIGPRPHPMSNQKLFMEKIAYYYLRSTVRPGVTGWAQVRHGYANNVAEETEKMRYDLYYIKNHSWSLDARIIFETGLIMLFGGGHSAVRQGPPLPADRCQPLRGSAKKVA